MYMGIFWGRQQSILGLWERGKDGSVRKDFHKKAAVSNWGIITLINHVWLSVSTV